MAPQAKSSILVIFGNELPVRYRARHKDEVIMADASLRKEVEALGCQFIALDTLTDPGDVYEASHFLEELSRLHLPDGTRVSKSIIYQGYELWWMHYGNIFNYYCLPYTQYKRMLEYLRTFRTVSIYRSPYKSLFFWYLKAFGCDITILRESGFTSPAFLPFGVFVQIVFTLVSLPILMLRRPRTMIFIGDKFEKDRDYDFRMKFVYEELRGKSIPFVEFIRSLESWKTVVKHAFVRRRPVIYSEGIAYIGTFISILSGERMRVRQTYGARIFSSETDPETRFKLTVATQYFSATNDDIWAIRIMKWILRIIGVKASFVPAASERSFHAVLGCKLNAIPTIGIMHGVASRYGTPYDFMSGFDGEKKLSVDIYGLWSEWWKGQYFKYSQAYTPEQFHISGPMRPLESPRDGNTQQHRAGPIRVLFIAEQVAAPTEVFPYLRSLMEQHDIALTIKFRPYRDGFEEWILKNEPQLLQNQALQVARESMQEAIKECDVVIGSYSTAALEALLQLKVPFFMHTRKWGDYYHMAESNETRYFLVESPEELLLRIKQAHTVSKESLMKLCEQYFGDPHKNGSKWVVEQLELSAAA